MSEPKVKAYDQLHVHIQRKTKKRLADYAKAKGQSQGSITDAALREYLDDDQGQQNTLLLRELANLKRSMVKLQRNQDVQDAALAGFVQLWLAYHPPLPAEQKDGAQRAAAQRFEQFVGFLEKQLQQQQGFNTRLTATEDDMRQEAVQALLNQEQDRGEG